MSVARDLNDEPVYGLGYYRISGAKDQRDSGLSIPAQRQHVRDGFEREGVIFVGEDSDVLQGTRTVERRGYQRILAAARRLQAEGKHVAIGVLRLDRFGRDMEERSRAWKEVTKLGIRLYAVRMGGWVDDALIYDLDAMMAAHEVRRVGQRVRETNEFVRRNLFPRVGRPPWGYRLREATPEERAAGAAKKNFEPHPIEAPVVRRAFDLRADGVPLREIHRWTRSLSADERGGRDLPWPAFRRIFGAAVYVARLEYPKGHELHGTPILGRPRGHWDPLVPDDVFARCLGQDSRTARVPSQASGRYLLTGLLRCPLCGGRMCGTRFVRKDGPPTHAYQCTADVRGASSAPCRYSVAPHLIERQVLDLVLWLLRPYTQPGVIERMELRWERLRRESAGPPDVPQRIAAAEARLSKWRRASAQAYADRIAGDLDKDEADAIRAQAAGEIEDARREIDRLSADLGTTRRLPRLREILAYMPGASALLTDGTTAQKRPVLADCLESVTPIREGRQRYRLRVVGTDLGKLCYLVARDLGEPPSLQGVGTLDWAVIPTPCSRMPADHGAVHVLQEDVQSHHVQQGVQGQGDRGDGLGGGHRPILR